MKVTLINSDAERRAGLKTLLRHIDRHGHFNEAKDWRQARHAIERLDPDLIVIDWQENMKPADLHDLLRSCPGIPAAVVVDDASGGHARRLLMAGALGVVPRSLDPQLLVRALEMVLLGGHYVPAGALDPDLAVEFAPRRFPEPVKLLRSAGRCTTLSPRQQQIMRCVHMGNTNKVIAKTLGISEGTVKIHLASIFQQLGAVNRAAAVAIYNGWQNGCLEVLRPEDNGRVRPALGEPGPVPLRTANARYSDPAENDSQLLLAAEPEKPFGR
ncbi:transcriptional regulator [Caballeronia arationis]|jgi:DNA-binding NarL/FixJ family response regulator|uniref:DNA-binding response regulator, NarL/FixJ family, contains REC and HTH domains n=1 Tax=Caballeronia arationis TaxID=1777142 RepID=A0A7Z7N3R0_9BURK|nr:response regulator transcription factor [Caballeronia arationis]SAK73386.1 transcriptional regulator [Caballeronia arationis]SOE81249.1 DNA-binding response regulator, NarL/FixJ family, contains REC and HTH domains [Caballeronia arationis]